MRALVADAQDSGDAAARMGAMQRHMQGKFKTHVEAKHAAGVHQLEHTLLVLDNKMAVLTIDMREMHQVVGVARVDPS